MSNLIINVFAFKEDYLNSPQLGGQVSNETIDIYLKNIYVSLCSAKKYNPNDDVAIITNNKLPNYYTQLFINANIKIFIIDFENFSMPKSFKWSLAFFKLNALKYVIKKTSYTRILLLDADTITVNNYDELWNDANYGVLLYNVRHSYNHSVRNQMIKDYRHLYQDNKNLVQYGGEFIAGTRNELNLFIDKCEEVYNLIVKNNYSISKNSGDELIISIAATLIDNKYDAGAYIDRYWTGSFYLVSTNYIYDPVSIWHVPGEKKYGILKIFTLLIKNEKILYNKKKMSRILGFPKYKRKLFSLTILYRIKAKLI